MELQTLELVRCTHFSRAAMEAIAAHAATLEELSLDGLCTGSAPSSVSGVLRSLLTGGISVVLVGGLCP